MSRHKLINRLTALELFVALIERWLPDIGGSFNADNAAFVITEALDALRKGEFEDWQRDLDEHSEWIKEYRKWKDKAIGWESEPE